MRSHNRLLLILLGLLWCWGGWSRTALAATAVAHPVSAAAAHAALRQVLGRQEFQTYTNDANKAASAWHYTPPRWLQNVLHAIGNFFRAIARFFTKLADGLGRLWRRIFGEPRAHAPTHAGHPFAWTALSQGWRTALYAILLGAVLLLLGLLLSRLLLLGRKPRTAGEPSQTSGPDARKRQRQEVSPWERSLDEAERLWRDGQQREALRVLYRACLALLDARGVLRYNETRANGEVLRALRRQGRRDLQQPLGVIVRSFDRSWYGSQPIADEEFATVLETSRRFRTVVMEDVHA